MTRRGRAVACIGTLLFVTIEVLGQTAPTAHAGPDQSVSIGDRVALDGSASTVANGFPTFLWTFVVRPDGSGAALSSRTAARPSFVVDVPGTYVLSLVVSDGQTTSKPDVVVITALNRPPIADAGVDPSVRVGEIAVLDGTQSYDPDFDRLTYEWSFLLKPDSSRATLTQPTSATPEFTVDAPGVFLVQLTVSDGRAASRPAVVIVRTVNSAPSARAGTDRSARIGEHVRLDASRSSDLDGDTVRYSWSFASRPFGSVAAFDDPGAVFPTFVPDLPGAYRARLVVSDGQTSSSDTVIISTNNVSPVADAGRDLHVHAGEVVRLDGSRSFDPDGQLLQFAWTLVGRPPTSSAALAESGAVRPSFFADVAGTYTAQLIVSDGLVSSTADEIRITTENVPPVAAAGRGQQGQIGSVVRVSGAASTDADGDELGFRWALVSQPAGSAAILFNVQAVRPTIVPDVAGTYVVQLVATAGRAISEPDTVVLTTEKLAPTAVAGPDQRVPVGFTAALDGTGSFDAAGLPLSFQWTLQARPPGSSAQLVRDAAVAVLAADKP